MRRFFLRIVEILLIVAVIGVVAINAWPLLQAKMEPLEEATAISTGSARPTFTATSSVLPALSPNLASSPSPSAPIANQNDPAFAALGNTPAILALGEGDHTHLFLYKPGYRSLTRISAGPWDDITPAISPDGNRLAFASNRNGYWDLYIMDLQSGAVAQLTDTPEYDASPTWSPDGLWMAYESYVGGGKRQPGDSHPLDGRQPAGDSTDG